MNAVRRKAQGAFEYILLLAGVLLIVVVVIMLLRGSIAGQANQTLQAAVQQVGIELSPFNQLSTLYVNSTFLVWTSGAGAIQPSTLQGYILGSRLDLNSMMCNVTIGNGTCAISFSQDNRSLTVYYPAGYGATATLHFTALDEANASVAIDKTTANSQYMVPCQGTNQSCGSPGACQNCSSSTGFYGSPFCVGNNRTQEYRVYYCNTTSCAYSSTNITVQQCAGVCSSGACDNPPSVSLSSPADGAVVEGPVSFSFVPADDRGLVSATLYLNGLANQTNQSVVVNGSSNSISVSLVKGNYNWTVRVCDNGAIQQCSFASNRTLRVSQSINFTSWGDVTANCVLSGNAYNCSGYNNIGITGAVNASNYSAYDAYGVSFEAANEFRIYPGGSINVSGRDNHVSQVGGYAGDVRITAQSILLHGSLYAYGGLNDGGSYHGRGGGGGNVYFNATTILVNASLNSYGGLVTNGGDSASYGGNAGSVSFYAVTITVVAPIRAYGGLKSEIGSSSSGSLNAGNGGTVSFNATTITVNASVDTYGGDNNNYDNAGSGGNIYFNASSVALNALINAYGGGGAHGGSNGGDVTITSNLSLGTGGSIKAYGSGYGNGGTIKIGFGSSSIPTGDGGDRSCTNANPAYQCYGWNCGYLYVDNEVGNPYRC
jgi:hypothetical protein